MTVAADARPAMLLRQSRSPQETCAGRLAGEEFSQRIVSYNTTTGRRCSTGKMMIVEGLLVSVGSANFDVRSFSFHEEANLNVYEPKFAAPQDEVFEFELARRVA